jgi:hypothetical protein
MLDHNQQSAVHLDVNPGPRTLGISSYPRPRDHCVTLLLVKNVEICFDAGNSMIQAQLVLSLPESDHDFS